MVDAFGPSGCEGGFRTACEIVMRVLRENSETVRNMLETFAHDPLVEWTKVGVGWYNKEEG